MPKPAGSPLPVQFTNCSHFTAESWAFWFVYIAPFILKGHFPHEKYFRHMCDLIDIIKTCQQFEITAEEINELEVKIINWVEKYEKYVMCKSYHLDLIIFDLGQVLLSVQGAVTMSMHTEYSWSPSYCTGNL
jgi:hypothetical protein